jgi:hypothetical protein
MILKFRLGTSFINLQVIAKDNMQSLLMTNGVFALASRMGMPMMLSFVTTIDAR